MDDYTLPSSLLRYFDLANSPYTSTAQDIIARRNASPDKQLFFDRLINLAELDGQHLYPPTSPAAFRRLLHSIRNGPVNRTQIDSFVYYLIRDADAVATSANGTAHEDDDMDGSRPSSSNDGRPRAESFARARCLPRPWKALMDGYWELDHGHWDNAVANLRDPSISDINFVPAIVQTLVTEVSPPSHALKLVSDFLLRPERKMVEQVEKDAALLACGSISGMSAAFARIRALETPEERESAREAIWCWSLGAPRTPAGKGSHTAQARALRELLHLVMNEEEHAHLVRFLAHPSADIQPPARSLLHDLVTLRLIHAGSYAETLQLDKELAATDATSAADRQRRREMVREFIDILPEAQRRALLAMAGDLSRPSGQNALPNGTASGGEGSAIPGSWVFVDPNPEAPVAPAAPSASTAAAPAPATSTPTRPVHAPTALRPAAVANLQSSANGTPSRTQTASPFSGPPRFAVASPRPAQGSPAPQRLRSPSEPSVPAVAAKVSAQPKETAPLPIRQPSPIRHISSPFQQPPTTSKPKTPARKQPRRMIMDEDEPAPPVRTTRRSSRRVSAASSVNSDDDASSVGSATPQPQHGVDGHTSRAPSQPPIPEDEVAEAPKPTGRGRRAPAKTAAPKAPAKQTTTAPATRRSGRASRANTAEPTEPTVPEDAEMPPPPIPGSFFDDRKPDISKSQSQSRPLEEDEPATPPQPAKKPRSRVSSRAPQAPATAPRPAATTRKVSRRTRASSVATDDADGADSDATQASQAPRPTRRSARTRAASERGSPTPSVVSATGDSPKARRSRAKAAPNVSASTSATPRQTRSRKA